MALNKELIKNRLKEAFGNDTQVVIGKKLNITQSTVSKLKSGDLDPTAEQLQSIATEYKVSVDWLLGVSDTKVVNRSELTYADILKGFTYLGELGVLWPYPNHMITVDNSNSEIPQVTGVGISDEIIQSMLHEWRKMITASPDIYQMWLEKRLEEYSSIPYIKWTDDVKALFYQTDNTWNVNPEFLKNFYEYYQEELKKREN